MEVLFIIGNGFDINIGMKTGYCDFYSNYQNQESESKLVKQLKEEIKSDLNNWSDLELAIGSFTNKINTNKEFDEMFDDIRDNLANYLDEQETHFDYSKIDKQAFFKYLCHPENSLPQAEINALKQYKDKWSGHQWNINIITFNYTLTLEKILGEKTKNIHIGQFHNSAIVLKEIQHIHGFTDDRMILGVNDISQISNETFHENEEILEAIIKTNCNKVQKHTIDDTCAKLISTANLICIFGSSIGDTDNNWWELIGLRLKDGAKVIIYSKGEEINQRSGYKKVRLEREIRNLFFRKTTLNDEEKKSLAENIYVGINTKMFSGM